MPTLDENGHFGKYVLKRELGRGATGTVYLAEDSSLGRSVALKILDQLLVEDAHFDQRFLIEARTVAQLEHRNIVALHSLERVGECVAIDMAYVPGGSLEQALAQTRLPLARLIAYMVDVLDALDFCHEQNIIHRDVKPSNILISQDNRAMLTDFGLAKVVAAQHSELMFRTSSSVIFVGTPRFAPPEAWDNASPTPAWDVYSVGAILYLALAPAPPFNADSPLTWIKDMSVRSVPPLNEVVEGVPRDLSDLVGEMMAHEPGARPSPARVARERLAEIGETARAYGSEVLTHIGVKRSTARSRRSSPGWTSSIPDSTRWTRPRLLAAAVCLALPLVYLLSTYEKPEASWLPARDDVTSVAVAGMMDFDSQLENTRSWYIRGTAEGFDALVLGTQALWQLHAAPTAAGAWDVTGHWADYRDDSRSVFRYGSVSGSGVMTSDNSLAVNAVFLDIMDGSETRRSVLVHRPEGTEPISGVAAHVMRHGVAPALLYNELWPRDLEWLPLFDRTFLLPGQLEIEVPYVAHADSTTASVPSGRTGDASVVVAPRSEFGGSARATLRVRHDQSNTAMEFHCPKSSQDMILEIVMCPQVAIPSDHSSTYVVRIDSDGALTSATHRFAGETVAVTLPWKVGADRAGEAWTCKIEIPKQGGAAHVGASDRWWLNARLLNAAGAGQDVIAAWGSEDVQDVLQGMRLHFEAPIQGE